MRNKIVTILLTTTLFACSNEEKLKEIKFETENEEQESSQIIKTNSLNKPIEDIKIELKEYILNNELKKLPSAPVVREDMFKLGQSLAFDKILSGNRDTSCLSCHHPLLGTGDQRSLPLGAGGKNLGQERVGGHLVPRNAPALFNLDLFEKMFWDGRVEFEEDNIKTPADKTGDLTEEMLSVFFAKEESEGFIGYGLVGVQSLFPVTSHHEMRGDIKEGNELAEYSGEDFKEIWEALMIRLGSIPEYVEMFEKAYPNIKFEDMTFAHAANAIAAFEIKAFDFRESPWQKVINDISEDGIWDKEDLLSEKEIRGAHFFFETGCNSCHSGSVTSDFKFHNIATAQFGVGKGDGDTGYEDYGRERVTGNYENRTQFRTAPLLNVELTAPYGHLGQFKDLASHIQIYAQPEKNWLNLYMGFDEEKGEFVNENTFEEQITEKEKEIFKKINLPSFDGKNYGFIRTETYITEKSLKIDIENNKLSKEEGKILGNGELNMQKEILVEFMKAQTDPKAKLLEHLIPEKVPSNLPVEKSIIED